MTMVLAMTVLLVVAFVLGVNVGGEIMSRAWDRANGEIVKRVFAPACAEGEGRACGAKESK